MEYALRMDSPHGLPRDPRDLCRAPWKALLPPGELGALYFGTEFCEDRLPNPGDVVEWCAAADRVGAEAVLLTPPVSPRGLRRVQRLLQHLARGQGVPAVVFNDWGVHQVLLEDHPEFPRRAGRLLNRALRDPRLAATSAQRRESGERGRYLRGFLAERGTVGLETDVDLEAAYLGDGVEGMQRVLHLPYAFATTGRNCLVKAQRAPATAAFTGHLAQTCETPCSGRERPVQREETEVPLWRAGNTLFYQVTSEQACAGLSRADRIVLHERPCP